MITARKTTCKIRTAISALAALFLVFSTHAQDEKVLRSGILLDGTYEKAEVTKKINGAKNTQLVAAHEWEFGVKNFSTKEWEKRKLDWDAYFADAKKLADDIAKKVEPKLVRDSRGVIEYAIIRGKDPFLSSIILSPLFLKIFEDTLGDNLHVVIIDRNLLYIFPAAGGKLDEYGPAIASHFRKTPLRVSLEIFLVNKAGFHAVGELERE